MMKKKSVAALFTAACLAAGSLAGCSGASSTASSEAADNTEASDAAQSADNTASDDDTKDLEDVTVILDYVANTNHTGMYVALDQGYYKDAGLNVSIVEPNEGATATGWGGPGEEAVLKAVMTQDGADFSKLNMVISDGSGFEALKDKVDVMWFFEGWDNIKCELADFPIHYMPVRDLDSRLDYYTPVIIANNDTLENKPEMVKKFLAATEKGYEYAIENPDESAEILLKYTPDSSPELLQKSQEYLADKYMEDTDQWGVMKDEVWDNYTDFMVEYGVIDKAIPAADCYTNEFLPEK